MSSIATVTPAVTTKKILCLANSRKFGGRCIVGKEMQPDRTLAWVRPVGATDKGEVWPDEMEYEDGSMPALLDVIELPVGDPKPLPYQPEDWLLAPGQWRRDRRADKANIDRWVDPPAPLWDNGFDSHLGKNDRFFYDPVKQLADSARFIGVPSLEIRVSEHKKDEGETSFQLRGAFEYEGNPYILRITDIDYEERYGALGAGTHKLGKTYLTVTVGEPFSRAEGEPEYHYKLIAAIIEA